MNPVYCKHLRTKKLYIADTPEVAFSAPEDVQGTACHFWCNLTQTVVGVDDRPVHKHACQPSRSCFE